jgi:hypothetical protein
MKKTVILIITTIFFFSCSKDEASKSSASINPPAWIQGTWSDGYGNSYRFTTNDFITMAGAEISYKEALESGQKITISETTTNSSYTIVITHAGTISMPYSFTKISNTEIKCSLDGTPILQSFLKQ